MTKGSTGWGTPPNAGSVSSGWGAPPPSNPSMTTPWGNPSSPASSEEIQEGSPVKIASSSPQSQQPQLTSTSWAAAAGKGISSPESSLTISVSEPSAKQLEQLNSVREALFSTDGWGSNNVKQDVPWHVEGMDTVSKDPSIWESGDVHRNITSRNDGTELWKSTLSGQPIIAKPSPVTQWHKPQNPADYRTWGEEDEATASFGAVGGNGSSTNGAGTIGSRDTSMWSSTQGPSSGLSRDLPDNQKATPGWNNERSRDSSGSRAFSESVESSNWAPTVLPRGTNNWNAPSHAQSTRASEWGELPPINRQAPSNGGPLAWAKQPQPLNQQAWKEMPRGSNPRPPQWNNSRSSGWNDQSDGNMWQEFSEKTEQGGRWGETGWSNGVKQRPYARTSPGWDENPNEIGGWRTDAPKKVFSLDNIRASKQFKVLMDMGCLADEAEFALRSSHGVLEDAIEMLNMGRLRDQNPMFAGQQSAPLFDQQRPFQSSVSGMYHQEAGAGFKGGMPSSLSRPPSSVKLNQGNDELKFIVSQIQMAVQAGYLNPRILNQPLSPNTLNCLNKLLFEIKNLNGLQQQQAQAALNGTNPGSINMNIMKAKQDILGLQNQINFYQSNYTPKTTQQQLSMQSSYEPPMGDFYGFGQPSNLPCTDGMLSAGNKSRLGRWMLQEGMDTKSSSGLNVSNLKTGLGMEENTWTTPMNGSSWPDTSSKQHALVTPTDSGSSAGDVFSIPEFIPGKLWSGHGMKNPDDDPSLTPASAAQIELNSSNKHENTPIAEISNRTESAAEISKAWQNGSLVPDDGIGPKGIFSNPLNIWSTPSAHHNDSQPRPSSFLPEGLLSDSM